jgi:hypothetical protein
MNKKIETPEQKKAAETKLFKYLIIIGIVFVLITKFTLYVIGSVIIVSALVILLYCKRPKFKLFVDTKLQKLNIFKRSK